MISKRLSPNEFFNQWERIETAYYVSPEISKYFNEKCIIALGILKVKSSKNEVKDDSIIRQKIPVCVLRTKRQYMIFYLRESFGIERCDEDLYFKCINNLAILDKKEYNRFLSLEILKGLSKGGREDDKR